MVEEIGFRSTRVRTLTGHLVTIPNEKVASESVETIGQRPYIGRLTNITITYDTPQARWNKRWPSFGKYLKTRRDAAGFSAAGHFNEFNDTSLNLIMIYWYLPADWTGSLGSSQEVNLQIRRAFET